MNFSLRNKLFLLVGFAISLAAIPIIYFSHQSLMETGVAKEKESFVNTVMLLEDNLSTKYLHLITSEVESVLNAKQEMRKRALLIQAQIQSQQCDEKSLHQWQKILEENDCYLAMFNTQGQSVLAPNIITNAVLRGISDFKGQPLKAILKGSSRISDTTYSVIRAHANEGEHEEPYLLCITPIRKTGTLVLAQHLADAEKAQNLMGERLLFSVREKLEALELGHGASLSILKSDGTFLAGKGTQISLDAIPSSFIEKVRKEGKIEGDTVNMEPRFLFHLAYFKAMDWYVLAYVRYDSIEEPVLALVHKQMTLAAGLIAVSLLIILCLAMRLISPLHLLSVRAKELAAKDFSSGDTAFSKGMVEGLPVGRRDEVGELAGAFSQMATALEENIRRLMETTASQQRMQGELNAARDIQMGILPPSYLAPKTDQYAAVAFLEPAKEVGGDLYDFFTVPDGRQAVIIGDVSDKGVSAALFMSMTVTLVRYALMEGLKPAQAMQRINDLLSENNPSCMFVTLFIGLFDPSTGDLEYASGAHCPPFVVSPDPSIPVRALTDTSGPLVGAMSGLEFTDCKAELAPGEYCLLYTDGVSEAMNEKLELLEEKRVAETLDSLRGADPQAVITGVMNAILAHRGNAAQSDDITMLCFLRKKVESSNKTAE